MMNLKKVDPLTIALVLGLAAAIWYKKNGGAKKEGYRGGSCCGR
jgi:hypothetical protein